MSAFIPQEFVDAEDTLLACLLARDIAYQKFRVGPDNSSSSPAPKHRRQKGVFTDPFQFEPMLPNKVYTYDLTSEDRLYGFDKHALAAHPSDILDGLEMVSAVPGKIVWSGYKRIRKRPKEVVSPCFGQFQYFEQHRRILTPTGNSYYTRVVAFNKDGDAVPLFRRGEIVGSEHDAESAFLACSLFEDAHRSSAYTCSIKDLAEIVFSINNEEIFEFFSMRDAPMTESGKRKALIHWVSRHIRRTSADKPTLVRSHYRGVTKFTVDRLTVNIAPNKDADITPSQRSMEARGAGPAEAQPSETGD